jgi:L-threonate 2-dehydrogenase
LPDKKTSPPKVAILGCGSMGVGIGQRLAKHGVDVVACLTGRSAASVARVRAAGIRDVSLAEFAVADLLLAIVPPAVAVAASREVVAAGVFRAGGPLYVDCNAVAPSTVLQVERSILDAGGRFVDAGIVGGPPTADGRLSPVLIASGSHASALAPLQQCGLEVQILDAPVGAASALKLCFASVSKGLTAIVALAALRAVSSDVDDEFRAHLSASMASQSAWAGRQIPMLEDKAGRWVGEMRELALFMHDIPGGAAMFNGAAEFYAWLADNTDRDSGPHATLRRFLAQQ